MSDEAAFDLSRIRSPDTLAHKIRRSLWGAAWILLFRPSPRICHGWRRFLLRRFGAQIGEGARIDNSVRIWAPWNFRLGAHSAIGRSVDCYCLAPIEIGSHSIVSQYTFLCTGSHDYTQRNFPVIRAPIRIGSGVWVAADVFIGPGVVVGDNAVVGARSSVFKSVEPGQVVVGTPARVIKTRAMANHGA